MKPDLLLLHGALGAPSQFDALLPLLEQDFCVHTICFSGHGGKSMSALYSIEYFATELRAYCEALNLQSPCIFGYSMGGYVALYAASLGLPVHRILTLGTKFSWSPEGAAKEVQALQPELIEEKVPKFAAYQAQLHSPLNWKDVMNGTAQMMLKLGANPAINASILSKVNCPVLCCRGTLDTMVSAEESQWAVDAIPNGNYQELEALPHVLEKVPVEELALEIRNWFTQR